MSKGKELDKNISDQIENVIGNQVEDEVEESIEDVLGKIKSKLSKDAMLYANLYIKEPLPPQFSKAGSMYVGQINKLGEIDNIEDAIRKLAEESNWGTCIYILRLLRSDQPRWKQDLQIGPIFAKEKEEYIEDIGMAPVASLAPAPESSLEQITKVAEVARTLKDLTGGKPDDSMNNMILMFTKGIEAATKSNPIPVVQEKPKSFLEQLQEFKALSDLMGNNQEKPKSLVEQITELKTLGEAIGMGGGEAVSPFNMLITTVGPKLPEIIQGFMGPIAELISLKKAQILSTMQNPQEALKAIENTLPAVPVRTASAAPGLPPSQEDQDAIQQQINLFLSKTKSLIIAGQKNDNAYSVILTGINYTFGPEVITQYNAGQVQRADIIDLLQSQDEYFKEPIAVDYVNGFFEWIDFIYRPQSYKCDVCGETTELTGMEFKQDQACECGQGMLERVIEVPANGAHES